MIDIGLNCRTAFVRNSELVIDRKQILSRYLKRWFTVDLIASIPWEAIFRIYEATQPAAVTATAAAAWPPRVNWALCVVLFRASTLSVTRLRGYQRHSECGHGDLIRPR